MDHMARAKSLLEAAAGSSYPADRSSLTAMGVLHALLHIAESLSSIDTELTQLRDDMRSRT